MGASALSRKSTNVPSPHFWPGQPQCPYSAYVKPPPQSPDSSARTSSRPARPLRCTVIPLVCALVGLLAYEGMDYSRDHQPPSGWLITGQVIHRHRARCRVRGRTPGDASGSRRDIHNGMPSVRALAEWPTAPTHMYAGPYADHGRRSSPLAVLRARPARTLAASPEAGDANYDRLPRYGH